jgi:hypothetical protein
MLSGLFKKKNTNVTCHFCKIDIDKSVAFVLKYKAADGSGSMNVCTECSHYLNNIIDTWESLNEKDD